MSEPPRAPELTGTASLLVFGLGAMALLLGGLWGWSSAGPMGGFLGVLLGGAVGVLGFTIARLMAGSRRFRERPAPDVRELPPDKALQVLSAMLAAEGASTGPELASGLLGQLGDARRKAERGELDAALSLLDQLAGTHPHAPAIPAERARVLRGAGRTDEATSAARRAIELALRGGMNRVAVQVLDEVGAPAEASLELGADVWRKLGRALAVQGRAAEAARCEARASKPT